MKPRVPSFDETETFSLRVLEAMWNGRRLPPLNLGAQLEPRPQLRETVARCMIAYGHRALLAFGGARHRTVLREGVRVEGRLWDPPLAQRFRLRFTDASYFTWLRTVRALPGAMNARWTDSDARRFGRFVATQGTYTGDWLFYVFAARNLGHKLPHLAVARAGYTRALAGGSPLARLLAFHCAGSSPRAQAQSFSALFSPQTVRLLECLDDLFVAHWTDLAQSGEAHSEAFWERAAAGLEAFVAAADRAHRLDLTEVVLRFLVELATKVFSGSPEEVRARLTRPSRRESSGTKEASTGRAQARRALGEAVSKVLDLTQTLDGLRQDCTHLRYGDPRYEEAQLFLNRFDATLGPNLHRAGELGRGLRGAIG